MAANLKYSAALHKSRMDAIVTAAGSGAKLWLYGGTQPAGPGTTHAQTLIAGPLVMAATFGTATTAVPSVLTVDVSGVAAVNAATSTQATWWRLSTSAGTDGSAGIVDGSAGTSGCDMTIGPTTAGQPVDITAWTITSAG